MITTLPKDPVILLSYINTKLRDTYESLDLLCNDLEVERKEIETILASIGYVYNSNLNKFI